MDIIIMHTILQHMVFILFSMMLMVISTHQLKQIY